MEEMPELKIPEDYQEPLSKQIIFILDKFPEKIRQKELDIIELNKEGLKCQDTINIRSGAILHLMIAEDKYKPGTLQFEQVHKSRTMRDEEFMEEANKKIETEKKIKDEKVDLNFLLNKFKGAQAIAQRKRFLES